MCLMLYTGFHVGKTEYKSWNKRFLRGLKIPIMKAHLNIDSLDNDWQLKIYICSFCNAVTKFTVLKVVSTKTNKRANKKMCQATLSGH